MHIKSAVRFNYNDKTLNQAHVKVLVTNHSCNFITMIGDFVTIKIDPFLKGRYNTGHNERDIMGRRGVY